MTQPQPQPPPTPTETLAIVGFICAFLLWPAGLILNPLALGRIKRSGAGGRGLAIAGFTLSIFGAAATLVVAVVLALGALAVERQNDRAIEAEAQSDLKRVATDVEVFKTDHGSYPDEVKQLVDLPDSAQAGVSITTVGSSYCLSLRRDDETYWYSSDSGFTDRC